ncbi:MAG: SDR family oxidoreductase [bacterium]|nr:SDR family oxidoreductase [bacterium]
MNGKVCLITGASSGIGKEAARALARMGADIVLVARDPARGQASRQSILSSAPDADIDLLIADFTSLRQVKQLAADITSKRDRLDVLLNNAGVTLSGKQLTEDGIEKVWAVNHFAPFLLTRELGEMLRSTPESRIVTVASDAHHKAKLNLNAMSEGSYSSGWRAYCDSKLANILFSKELARRMAGDGVVANCLHPGVVATGFARKGPPIIRLFFKLARRSLLTPEQGAETLVYLASSEEGGQVSGGYFHKCRQATPSTTAQDEIAAERLWEISERVIGE